MSLAIILNFLFQQDVAMADQMRADGKIWVVITVITLMFIGIVGYLISLDRKISKLEKQVK